MSVEKLKKIEIVALNRTREKLLDILQGQGSVHIISISDSFSEFPALTHRKDSSLLSENTGLLGQIDYSLNYLKRFSTLKKGILESLKETPMKVSKGDIQSLLSDFNLEDKIKTYQKMEKNINALDTERLELNGKLKDLSPWQALDVPLKYVIEGSKFLDFCPFLVPIEQIESFKKSFEPISSFAELYQIQDMEIRRSFIIAALKSKRSKVEELLHSFEIVPATLPSIDETPAKIDRKIRERIDEIKVEKIALENEGKRLLADLDKLRVLYDYYYNNEAKAEVQKRFGFTEQAFVITGWIKETDINELIQNLNQLESEIDIEILEPGKVEALPVVLKNNKFSSPFELITKLYDLPHYQELDPTPILAPFFFLFFGLCLTDLGYGLILVLVSLWGLKKLYLKGGSKKLLQLFFLCGISTIFCGLLAGSWFGDLIDYLPGWLFFLKNIKNSVAILDPIKDPLKFLILSLTLGFIQVITGIFVQIYKDMKANDFYSAFLRRLPWVILLSSLILLVVTKAPGANKIFKCISILSATTICLFEGKSEKNIFKRIGTGLLALYGTVGYYADMLSYCRLLALGLATAVIANVVNQMATISRGIPYVGIIFMILIFIGGHIFNLLINLLGAFVHTSRLQFVEFFTKFFEGGGKAFIPFARNNRYTYIE